MTTTIDRRPRSGERRHGEPRGRPAEGRPRMDPRLRQRRVAVLRDQGRRRLRILLALVSVPAVVLVGVLALRSSWFSVAQVRVAGTRETPVAAVKRSVAAALHRPLINVDLARLEADVEALPWVRRATVERSWPSTLVVTVTERQPVAAVAFGHRFAELDSTGRVLALVGSAPAHQPRLTGAVPAGTRPGATLGSPFRLELEVAAGLPGPLAPQVAAIGPDGSGGVELTLTQPAGARVELGVPSDLPAKMAALETVLSQVDLTGVRSVDLRVPGQPALTRS